VKGVGFIISQEKVGNRCAYRFVMPGELNTAIVSFEALDRIIRGLIILIKVFLALSVVGFSVLAISFGVINKLAAELHFLFLPAGFIGALIGVLLICFYSYNKISSIQEKIASILEVLQTEELHSPGALKAVIYETVQEACGDIFDSSVLVIRVLFFTPGAVMTVVGIILVLVATVNVVSTRPITLTCGCLFIGSGAIGGVFIIIAYKYVTKQIRGIRTQLDEWLVQQAALAECTSA